MLPCRLELFEEITCRAGDIDSAGNAAFAVLDALNDACCFGALRTFCALVGIHDLLAVACFGNLCHYVLSMLPVDLASCACTEV